MYEIITELIILTVKMLLILSAYSMGKSFAVEDLFGGISILIALTTCLVISVIAGQEAVTGEKGTSINIVIFLITFLPFIYSYTSARSKLKKEVQ